MLLQHQIAILLLTPCSPELPTRPNSGTNLCQSTAKGVCDFSRQEWSALDNFTGTSVELTTRTADTIQQMYLKELQSYKAPPVKAGDSEGHVQKFSPPAPPKAPEDTDLAKDMKAYEDQVVEIEGQAATGEQTELEGDYFEDLKQFDEEPAHH